MAEQNFPSDTIYQLDDLPVLRGMNSETVDQIATDPPFNTGQIRTGIEGRYSDRWKWGNQGIPPDQLGWNEVHPEFLEQIQDDSPKLAQVIAAAKACHGPEMAAYLTFLGIRLLEMHRVLKPTGSLYLHCDHTANAYIRMALDAIFGAKNCRSEIVWRRYGSHNDASRRYGRVHDTILFYSKSNDYNWTGDTRERYRKEYLDRAYRSTDTLGNFTTAPLHARGLSGGGYEFTWRDITDTWRFPREKLDEMDANGEIHWPSKGTVGLGTLGNYRLFASFRYQDNSQRAQLIASGRALQIGLPPPDFPFLPHIALVPFPDRFIDAGKLPLHLDSCLRWND